MTVYIVDIEAVDTRYTKEWKDYLPEQIHKATGCEVVVVSGGDVPQTTTPGAFLNFGGTNVYKSKQLEIIGEMFCNGQIKDNDYFLYTDAWNPTVIQLKYMAELLGVKIKIGGLWHAGSYDNQDFLGRLIGNAQWVRSAERSMFYAYDNNFFATDFHSELLSSVLFDCRANDIQSTDSNKLVQTGWPMEYLYTSLQKYSQLEKRNLILFPHRIAPEKQLDIFLDLKQQLPQYEFVVCQDQQLSKAQYHQLLAEAKVVFSANLQETLGISWYEGAVAQAIPMVPDRLSYTEMALADFKYPSLWTESYEDYTQNRDSVVDRLTDYIENYNNYLPSLATQVKKLQHEFFSGTTLYSTITQSIVKG
jgi:hypothetical protein